MPVRRRFSPLPQGAVAWVRRGARVPFILASLVCSLAWAGAGDVPAVKKPGNSRKLGLSIQVQGGGWGRVSRGDIETVLYATADELLARLPNRPPAPIVVTHTDGPPVALYGRGEQGEFRVRLHARGENWHLYAYEFAHELCHLLSNHDAHVGADGEARRHNQWFEEALCETASLYVLKNLAAHWSEAPPGPRWVDEGPLLQRFFDTLIAEGHRRLPAGTPLAVWLREHEQALRRDPYLRQKNELLATLLLPLFESDPDNWQALAYLNLHPDDARAGLRGYLAHWYRNAPLEHRALVAGVLAMLDLDGVMPLEAGPEAMMAAIR